VDKVFDAGRHPLATRVGTAATQQYQGPHAPEHAFELGLRRLLDGVGVFVDGGSRSR
jgi:hypothetical protein